MADADSPCLAGARLTIDLGALAYNWRALDDLAGSAECAAAVKGDGYGIGLEQTVETLSAAGCRTFFTAVPQEGLRARAVSPSSRVFVLCGPLPGTGEVYRAGGLIPVLNSKEDVLEWAAYCAEVGLRLPAALHIDTGMNRLGLRLDEARLIAQAREVLQTFDLVLVMSHLACGGDSGNPLNALQRERFLEAAALFPQAARSLANSAGIFLGADYRFDLVRPGIALYGGEARDAGGNPMRTVATASARVLTVRVAEAGETVGYGATQTLTRRSRLALLAAGYADGYPRLAGSESPHGPARAWIAGYEVPLVGRVSMDLIAVDVTDVPEELCERGAWVELFGPHIAIDSVARHAETIGYELLTGLGRRYARRYVNGPGGGDKTL